MVTSPSNSTNSTTNVDSSIAESVQNQTDLPPVQSDKKFEWDTQQQNFVLGTFFWGYILTELPGGR